MTDEQARQLGLLLMPSPQESNPNQGSSPFRRSHHQLIADALLAGATGVASAGRAVANGLGVFGDFLSGTPRTMDDIREGAFGASQLAMPGTIGAGAFPRGAGARDWQIARAYGSSEQGLLSPQTQRQLGYANRDRQYIGHLFEDQFNSTPANMNRTPTSLEQYYAAVRQQKARVRPDEDGWVPTSRTADLERQLRDIHRQQQEWFATDAPKDPRQAQAWQAVGDNLEREMHRIADLIDQSHLRPVR